MRLKKKETKKGEIRMDLFTEPANSGFTIYCKSGCANCSKAKSFLKTKSIFFVEVDCDEYLIESKELFLTFVKNKVGEFVNTFPIIFCNGMFIGGFNKLKNFVDKLEFDQNNHDIF